jgi:hypothetical protein
MAAASDLLSPELALVDPQLVADPRVPPAAFTNPRSRLWDPAAPDGEPVSVSVPSHPGSDAISEARKRLMEAGLDSDVLGSLVPARRHFRRRASVIPASAAATSVALLVLQVYLGNGGL